MSDRRQIHVLVFAHDPDDDHTYYFETESSDLLDADEAREEALDELWPDELWSDGWEPITIAASMTADDAAALAEGFRSTMEDGTLYYAQVFARRARAELVLGDCCVFANTPDDAAERAAGLVDAPDVWPDAEICTRLMPLCEAIELSAEEAQAVIGHEWAVNHATD